jgi:MFS family permease
MKKFQYLFVRNDVPQKYRSNFYHLFFDIAWFGVLNGSTLAFLNIYAARLGASGFQIGLINAMPAVVTLIFAIPSGSWLKDIQLGKSVFISSVFYRIFYLFFAFLPFFSSEQSQIWLSILVLFIMGIPGTIFNVGFQPLFAQVVPEDYRGYVAGIRNAFFAVFTVVTSLVSGVILNSLPFPQGYIYVFLLGFIGAAMSSLHIWFITPEPQIPSIISTPQVIPSRKKFNLKVLLSSFDFRLEILKSPFGIILALLFGFHLFQYLAIPVFPLYTVNVLHLSDQVISLGTSIFYIMVFLGSLQLERLSQSWGNRKIIGIGVVLLSVYPILLSVSHGSVLYWITSLVGGVAWALAGGVIYNYLLEKVPPQDRPAHMAWYNLILNAAILIGSVAGPAIAGIVALPVALILFGVGRLASGLAILRWG